MTDFRSRVLGGETLIGSFSDLGSPLAGEGQDVVSRAGTFVADGDRVTPVREEKTGAVVQ